MIAFVFEKCDTDRSDLSAEFPDLDQGSPDTKLKTYVASAALKSLNVFCFSDLRNNKWTTVDRCLSPSSAPLYFSCKPVLHHTTFILDRYLTKSRGSAGGLFQRQSSSTLNARLREVVNCYARNVIISVAKTAELWLSRDTLDIRSWILEVQPISMKFENRKEIKKLIINYC